MGFLDGSMTLQSKEDSNPFPESLRNPFFWCKKDVMKVVVLSLYYFAHCFCLVWIKLLFLSLITIAMAVLYPGSCPTRTFDFILIGSNWREGQLQKYKYRSKANIRAQIQIHFITL